MWLIYFFALFVQAAPSLDFELFKAKVQPLLTEKRPGHARCITCHSTGTAFRLIGTGVSALREGSLADDTDMLDRRSAHAERAMDDLRKKFGNAAVIRGIAYKGPAKEDDEEEE